MLAIPIPAHHVLLCNENVHKSAKNVTASLPPLLPPNTSSWLCQRAKLQALRGAGALAAVEGRDSSCQVQVRQSRAHRSLKTCLVGLQPSLPLYHLCRHVLLSGTTALPDKEQVIHARNGG